MFQKLQTLNRWEYSKQVWYNKYHTAVEIGYYTRYGTQSIRFPETDSEYRLRQRYTPKGIITTVYTSDTDFALSIKRKFKNKVLSIRSPISDSHLEALKDKTRIVEVRDKLFHNKYRLKVHTHKKFVHGFDREMWNAKVTDANKWIKENFKKSRTLNNSTFSAYALLYGYPHYNEVVCLYTNDEESLMLYKMAFGNDFDIDITHAFTPQDFASA